MTAVLGSLTAVSIAAASAHTGLETARSPTSELDDRSHRTGSAERKYRSWSIAEVRSSASSDDYSWRSVASARLIGSADDSRVEGVRGLYRIDRVD